MISVLNFGRGGPWSVLEGRTKVRPYLAFITGARARSPQVGPVCDRPLAAPNPTGHRPVLLSA